jgi:hypothetical protein
MSTASYAFQDLINEHKVIVTELGQKTQDLITKFSALTDDDAKDAMDEKIYGQIEDFLDAKAKKAKEAATKEKVTATKAAKADPNKIDVSTAGTSAAVKAAADAAKTTEPVKSKSPLGTIFGR